MVPCRTAHLSEKRSYYTEFYVYRQHKTRTASILLSRGGRHVGSQEVTTRAPRSLTCQ